MKTQFKFLSPIFAVMLTITTQAQIKVWTGGNTYIGNTTTTPLSKLSVGGAGNSLFKIYGYNSDATTTGVNAIRGENATPTSNISSYSVAGIITPGTTATCVGVVGAAYRTTTAAGARAFGVYGYAGNAGSGYNYGVYGLLLGSNNGAAIFSTLGSPVSIGGQYAAYFDGTILTTASNAYKPGGGSWTTTSDERLKTDITQFSDGMAVINHINPIKYKYNGLGGLPTDRYYYGVKAQEMQEVAPYTVGTIPLVVNQDETGTFNVIDHLQDSTGNEQAVIEALSFNYDALIYVMINSLKEHDAKINDLQNKLLQCCNAMQPRSLNGSNGNNGTFDNQEQQRTGNTENPTTVVELSYADNAILYQNIPNPFGDETTVNYYLPQNANTAKIIFFNNMGQSIKEVVLENKGNASLTLKTSELAQGIYSYSLLVDGKVIDTKKMLKNK